MIRLQVATLLALLTIPIASPRRAVAQTDFPTIKREVGETIAKARDQAHRIQQDTAIEQFDELQQHLLIFKENVKQRRSTNGYLYEADIVVPPPAGLKGFTLRKTSQAVGKNTQYRFFLTRPAGSIEWQIQTFFDGKSGAEEPGLLTLKSLSRDTFPAPAFVTGNSALLPDVFDSPSFKLVKCEASPTNPQWTRVTYENSKVYGTNTEKTSGWCDLDPSFGWCIREADEKFVMGNSIRTHRSRIKVSANAAVGLPNADEVRYEFSLERDGKVIAHRVAVSTHKAWIDEKIPEREFSLTAYGLPEPLGVKFEEKRTPTYVWLLAGAGGCGLLALAFRRMGSRQPRPIPT